MSLAVLRRSTFKPWPLGASPALRASRSDTVRPKLEDEIVPGLCNGSIGINGTSPGPRLQVTTCLLERTVCKLPPLRKEIFVCGRKKRRNKPTDDSLIAVHASWPAHEAPELRARVLRGLRVLPDFVSEAQEAALLAELEPVLRRMRYEFDHWDNAIHGYRETERASWSEPNAATLRRARAAAFAPRDEALPHAHVLDLAPAGHIRAHVDAVRFCGAVIAGLCLLSPAVLRLQHVEQPHRALDALLPRRCLYIMRDAARYEFSHAVPGGEESAFRGERVRRARRVAVIARSRPGAEHAAPGAV